MLEHSSKSVLLSFRITPTIEQKIDALAHAVRKPRSAVLRALILQATLDELPAAWTGVSDAEKAFLEEVEG